MSAVRCQICFEPLNAAYYYANGHTRGNVPHIFDSVCIHKWLAISPNCPICRDPLRRRRLQNFRNLNFSWQAFLSLKFSEMPPDVKKALIFFASGNSYALSLVLNANVGSGHGLWTGSAAVLFSAIPLTILLPSKLDPEMKANRMLVNCALVAAIVAGTSVNLWAQERIDFLSVVGTNIGSLMGYYAFEHLSNRFNLFGKDVIPFGFPNEFITTHSVPSFVMMTTAFFTALIAGARWGLNNLKDESHHLVAFTATSVACLLIKIFLIEMAKVKRDS